MIVGLHVLKIEVPGLEKKGFWVTFIRAEGGAKRLGSRLGHFAWLWYWGNEEIIVKIFKVKMIRFRQRRIRLSFDRYL